MMAQMDEANPTLPAFLKGIFINGKSKYFSLIEYVLNAYIYYCVERSYFMLDTETDLCHFFR